MTCLIASNKSIQAQSSDAILDKIIINNDTVLSLIPGYDTVTVPYIFKHFQKDFRFILSASEGFYYSFYLEGYDKIWSEWSPYPLKEYTNMSSGYYTLKLRVGEQGRILSEESLLSFRVKLPVFLSPLFLILYLVVAIIIFWIIYRMLVSRHINRQQILEQLVFSRTEELKDIKEKTESLLANVLPKGTADELMLRGKATKKKFNFATVLFSDIQGFSKIAEEVNPEVLIDELDKFFFHFDTVVEKYNIEKIKTIGDAYMCAGGIPKRNRTNPIEVILAALEMSKFMEDLKKEQQEKGQIFWDIRIGLHTGTVIAGVIGHKKLSYDIWGDTVNTASRMESSGEAGKINISGTTYEYAKEFFICEYRGKMPVKYKGELDMYFVNGIRPELRMKNRVDPNQHFLNKLFLIKLLDLEDDIFEAYSRSGNPNLVFHDIRHIKNVATQSELLGRAEGLKDEEIIALRLASIFVFAGKLTEYSAFLEESCGILKKSAPEYGFEEGIIKAAGKVIKDAFLALPKSEAGNILSDAVYDFYGRVDYIIRLELLYSEELSFLSLKDKASWFKHQADLLGNHEFKTSTARLLRTNPVEKQLEVLKEYISKL